MFLSLMNTAFWSDSTYSHTSYYLKEQLFFIITGIIWLRIFDRIWERLICWSVIIYKFELLTYTLLLFLFPETELFLNAIYDITIGITIILFTLVTFYYYARKLSNHDFRS